MGLDNRDSRNLGRLLEERDERLAEQQRGGLSEQKGREVSLLDFVGILAIHVYYILLAVVFWVYEDVGPWLTNSSFFALLLFFVGWPFFLTYLLGMIFGFDLDSDD